MLGNQYNSDIQNKKDIITGADKLLELINERGLISLTEVSTQLKIDKLIIEHWSEALSEQGIIKMKFGFKDIFLMTPTYFKMTDGKVSFIKELFSMNTLNIKSSPGEKETHLLSKEKELDTRAKTIVSSMKKITQLSVEVQKKKTELLEKEIHLKKTIKDFDKIKSVLQIKEKQMQQKEKAVELAALETKKKAEEARLLKSNFESEKKDTLKLKSIILKDKKEIEAKFQKYDKLKVHASLLSDQVQKLKLKQIEITAFAKEKKASLIKKTKEIRKKEVFVIKEKQVIRALKASLAKNTRLAAKERMKLENLRKKESAEIEIRAKKLKEKESMLKELELSFAKKMEPAQFKELIQEISKQQVMQA